MMMRGERTPNRSGDAHIVDREPRHRDTRIGSPRQPRLSAATAIAPYRDCALAKRTMNLLGTNEYLLEHYAADGLTIARAIHSRQPCRIHSLTMTMMMVRAHGRCAGFTIRRSASRTSPE